MKIVVLPGDAIGPEITAVTVQILARLNHLYALDLDIEELPIGLDSLRQFGTSLTDEVLATVREAQGVVLAPLSTYDYPAVEQGGINPSGTIRKALDLYANIRPARNYDGVETRGQGIDLVIVRENTEGFYADRNLFQGMGEFMPSADMAISLRRITRHCCERIARSACDLAMRRRQHLTLVHKANVLRVSDGLFRDTVLQVVGDYPDLEVDEMLIDAMAAALVRRPDDFDVVVTTNMYGDILSDLAAEMTGGLGLGGALNAGQAHAVAQASHGSAPDIGGQNRANPTALLLSTAMLLAWLGNQHEREALCQAAQALENAVARTLAKAQCHTADLGGSTGTDQFGAAVLAALD